MPDPAVTETVIEQGKALVRAIEVVAVRVALVGLEGRRMVEGRGGVDRYTFCTEG